MHAILVHHTVVYQVQHHGLSLRILLPCQHGYGPASRARACIHAEFGLVDLRNGNFEPMSTKQLESLLAGLPAGTPEETKKRLRDSFAPNDEVSAQTFFSRVGYIPVGAMTSLGAPLI
jgi:hypothetical protein